MARKSTVLNKRLNRIWGNMKQRCFNKNCPCYEYYGGKGVSVCSEWADSYENFQSWALSHGYADNLEIDRIDSDKNYDPENCQWITHKENAHRAAYDPDKKIMCIETGMIFDLVVDAAKWAGLKNSASIFEAMRSKTYTGEMRKAGGYTWARV